ncbi:MAG TPA: flagellar hook-basal body complex protein [Chloroflexota bacterium]|jgi:flagellar basal-body rod protein FlgG|nr:flagellar hook-basal body complex protein [Chloroflexota bacterium]
MGLFGLDTAATGMRAQQTSVDISGNNMANIDTVGFRGTRGDFQDLLVERLDPSGGGLLRGDQTLHASDVGAGQGLEAAKLDFQQGALRSTGGPTDMAIDGEGFFQVRQANGQTAYTRDGSFVIDGNGDIVDHNGNHLLVQAPGGGVAPLNVVQNGQAAQQLRIDSNGVITGVFPGANPQDPPTNFGTVQLARFVNPQGLVTIGGNLFQVTPNSGAAITGLPGTGTQAAPGAPLLQFGQVWQKFLEASNVNMADELSSVINAQRNYQMNLQSFQTADQMWQLANDMKHS